MYFPCTLRLVNVARFPDNLWLQTDVMHADWFIFNVLHVRALYYTKTLITNKCTKSIIINRNTLLHVSTLLGHLQGELLVIVTLGLHFIVEWECAVDCVLGALFLEAWNLRGPALPNVTLTKSTPWRWPSRVETCRSVLQLMIELSLCICWWLVFLFLIYLHHILYLQGLENFLQFFSEATRPLPAKGNTVYFWKDKIPNGLYKLIATKHAVDKYTRTAWSVVMTHANSTAVTEYLLEHYLVQCVLRKTVKTAYCGSIFLIIHKSQCQLYTADIQKSTRLLLHSALRQMWRRIDSACHRFYRLYQS
jgi:hypothetical protein